MFAVAKQINTYNAQLQALLQPPLNQLKIAQITDKTAIFIAKNSSLLAYAKGQSDVLLNILRNDLDLKVDAIEIKLVLKYRF
jgi:hypothetical protein